MLEAVVALAAKVRAMYRARAGASRATLAFVLVALTVVGAAHLARFGTERARGGAAALLVSSVVAVVVLLVVERRRWRDPRRALIREISRTDADLAQRIDRAAGLVVRSRKETAPVADTERELSELHLSRQLAKVRIEPMLAGVDRRATYVAGAAFLLATLGASAAALDPFRVVEGIDVLFARDGHAPLRLVYLEDIDVVATPPAYVGRHEEPLSNFDMTEQVRGTVLAVRGKPQRPGRALFLTDGKTEIPFVDDGRGNVVARWSLKETVDLRIAARFGEVTISQKDSLTVESIPDLPPAVRLEGAPKTVKLVDAPKLTLAYEAQDDFGLTEIALVLRSGPKVETRTLSKPSGAKRERGAHELSTQEPFFRGTFVPVEVTIEAKDNDAVLGPKWGASSAFIVMPPLIGEPEALRYAALLTLRDALVDLLAPRVLATVGSDADAKARVETEKSAQDAAVTIVEEVIAGTYGGLGVRGRIRRVVSGQMRRLGQSLDAFVATPNKETYASLLTTTEQVVLAIDAAIQRLGVEDAKKISKGLSKVADEAANASRAARDPNEAERGINRLAAALVVLEGGGAQLAKLGALGADLGDIAVGGSGRIVRERDATDYVGSELAALDLARRLREPVASIGGGGRPGVESGVGDGSGSPGESDDASDADEQAESDGKELDELIKRHQQELDKVEKALENATTPEEKEALKKLAKEQAEAIRQAVKDLPEQGLPGSAAEKAAQGKKSAESMAGSLEKGNIKEAIKTGKEALQALREAKKRESGAFLDDEQVAKESTSAGNRVEEALEDLERALKNAESSAKGRAQEDLKKSGENEGRMSERTRDLKKRGEEGDASMPEDTLDRLEQAEKAMKEAAKALEEGDADTGREKQKEAQRYLEMAREDEEPNDGNKGGPDGDSDDSEFSQDAEVPDKDKHQGPEEFRRRVVEGLGKPGDPRLKEAVRRYAEGLLK